MDVKSEIPHSFSYLEVRPGVKALHFPSKFVKLVFRMDSPVRLLKNRLVVPKMVKLEIRTEMDNCAWYDDFDYSGTVQRMKDDFLNLNYIRSYLKDGALVLKGTVTVREPGWVANEEKDGTESQLVRDIRSLAASGTLSDFKFIVSGHELEVHKAILAGESSRFRLHRQMSLRNFPSPSALSRLRANVQRRLPRVKSRASGDQGRPARHLRGVPVFPLLRQSAQRGRPGGRVDHRRGPLSGSRFAASLRGEADAKHQQRQRRVDLPHRQQHSVQQRAEEGFIPCPSGVS